MTDADTTAEALLRALDENPNDRVSHSALADLYEESGRDHKALAHRLCAAGEVVVEIDPRNAYRSTPYDLFLSDRAARTLWPDDREGFDWLQDHPLKWVIVSEFEDERNEEEEGGWSEAHERYSETLARCVGRFWVNFLPGPRAAWRRLYAPAVPRRHGDIHSGED